MAGRGGRIIRRTPETSDDLREEVEERDVGTPEFESIDPVFEPPPERTDEEPVFETPSGFRDVEFRGIQFSNQKPDLKFAVEVATGVMYDEDKETFESALPMPGYKGILLCFSLIERSEIYEIWRRKISETNDFSRAANTSTYVANTLARTKYFPTLKGVGIDDATNIGVFIDMEAERNQVYEYKVVSITTPTAEDWSITAITSRTRFALPQDIISDILRSSEEDDTSPLDEISTRVFGMPDYGWVIGTLNPHIDFFGTNEMIIQAIQVHGYVDIPVSIQEFIREVQKGISSHGICSIIEKIAAALGSIDSETLKVLLSILSGTSTINEDVIADVRTELVKNAIPVETSTSFMESEREEKERVKVDTGDLPERGMTRGVKKTTIKYMKDSEALGDKSGFKDAYKAKFGVKNKLRRGGKFARHRTAKIDMASSKGIGDAFNVMRASKLMKSGAGTSTSGSRMRITPKITTPKKTTITPKVNAQKIGRKFTGRFSR